MRNLSLVSRLRMPFAYVGALCVVMACTVLTAPSVVWAQATPGGITLNLQNAPIQQVLTDLFKGAGKNFTINPNITGNVTIDVNGVSFDTALAAVESGSYPSISVSDQNGLYTAALKVQEQPAAPIRDEYRGGRPMETATTTTATQPKIFFPPIKINHYDAYDMTLLIAAFDASQAEAPTWVPSDPPVQQSQNGQNGQNGGNRQGGFGQNGMSQGGIGTSGLGGIGTSGLGGIGTSGLGGIGTTGLSGIGTTGLGTTGIL